MDSTLYHATVVAIAIALYMLLGVVSFMVYRKFNLHQENKRIASSSNSSSSASSLSYSSSVSSSSSPTSLSHNPKHEVFLSFRGPDVRKSLVSHLMKELKRKAIDIFIDNNIMKSNSIRRELNEAIRGSEIAIVIFSSDYASSSWCLDELVEIVKCSEDSGQKVMPLFYNVPPTDVGKQTGDFGKAFYKTCEGRTKENVEFWKNALAKVSIIAGYHSSYWDDDAAMIESISNDVSNKLMSNSSPSSECDGLVGMEDQREKFEPLLRLDSNDVRIIGIWGPSGMGKTSFARYLYNNHSQGFDLRAFMTGIKGYTRPSCSDDYAWKLELQQQLMSQILQQKDIEIHRLGVVQNRLKDKKVFIVLDDVNGPEQLEALAKENQWFGPGSRIIITTRNIKILNARRLKYIHKVEFPTYGEAFQIFCMNAFGQNSPKDGFEELARDAMCLEGIHPSEIKVMGTFFQGMSEEEWRKEMSKQERIDALRRLRTNPDTHNPFKNSELGVKFRMTTQRGLWRAVRDLEKIVQMASAEADSDNLMIKTKQMILPGSLSVMKKIHMSGVEAEAARVYKSCIQKEIDEGSSVNF